MSKLSKFIAALGFAAVLAGGSGFAQAALLLQEGFDDISTLPGSGWALINNSAPAGSTSWFQGEAAVFAADSGAADSYIAANFENAAPGGVISNWLITPALTLAANEELNFALRLLGEGFLDTVEVRYSTNGASTDVGGTPTSVGDFTNLLASYSSASDTGWVHYSLNLNGVATTGRIAFRYVAADTDFDGDYIGIDTLSVNGNENAIPEPATLALFGIGLAGLCFARRKQ